MHEYTLDLSQVDYVLINFKLAYLTVISLRKYCINSPNQVVVVLRYFPDPCFPACWHCTSHGVSAAGSTGPGFYFPSGNGKNLQNNNSNNNGKEEDIFITFDSLPASSLNERSFLPLKRVPDSLHFWESQFPSTLHT